MNIPSVVIAEFGGGKFGLILRFAIRKREINVHRKSFQEYWNMAGKTGID